MTDEEIKQHMKAALDEHLPKVFANAYEKICAEQSAVVEREREASDSHARALVLRGEEEQQRRDKREGRLWKYVIGPLMALSLGGGGVGIYQNRQTEETVDDRVGELETVIVGCPNGNDCTKEQKKQSVTGRVDTAEKKINRLGELHFQQLKVIVDQGDEQRKKLDKISDKAQEVPVPKSADDARDAVEAHDKLKRKKLEKKLADEAIKKGDAFAGIDDEE